MIWFFLFHEEDLLQITHSLTHTLDHLPLQNVVIGLTPFVDNFTHLGGMVYGFLCGLGKLERLSHLFFGVKKGLVFKFRSSMVRFFGFILSIVCIIITLIVLVKSDGERMTNCRGCRYVSCVPFPFWADYQDKVCSMDSVNRFTHAGMHSSHFLIP